MTEPQHAHQWGEYYSAKKKYNVRYCVVCGSNYENPHPKCEPIEADKQQQYFYGWPIP